MGKSQAWINAARPRTLPLALASILLGSFLAAYAGDFRWSVFLLAAVTTICLQVLSNLANDYGDSIHGADSHARTGPARAVQSGHISEGEMRKAMYLFVGLSLLSGVGLLILSFQDNPMLLLIFLGIGLLAIAAAVLYTSGKRPYGYAGLGDISVMIFFGFVGVMGTYFLFTNALDPAIALLAGTSGFFATAVLNINNIRDIESDKDAGKLSIPVRIGRDKAVIYHWFLLAAGWSCAVVFVLLHYRSPWQFLFVLSLPLFVLNGIKVSQLREARQLDPYLKQMALSTLLFVVLMGVGLLMG